MKRHHKLTKFEIAIFFRQFATMLAAGIPIAQACRLLEANQRNIALSNLVTAIKTSLHAGYSLSTCLQRYPVIIDNLICQLIYLSEQTGTLDNMLIHVADHLEQSVMMTRKIKQALFYPAIILLAGLLITLGMLIFIIPRFKNLFADTKPTTLPIFTQCIFYLSDALRTGLIPFLIALFIIMIYWYRQRPSSFNDLTIRLITNFPMVNNIWQQIVILRFCRNLAITLAAGVTITKALALSSQACGDTHFAAQIHKAGLKITSGQPLHQALQMVDYFSPLQLGLIKTGEDTGKLEAMLTKAALFLESDLKQIFERLSQLLEPLIMIILGVLIGGLVIGMYLPVFNLGSTI